MEQQDRISPEEWAAFAAEQGRRQAAHEAAASRTPYEEFLEAFRRLGPDHQPAFPVEADRKAAYRQAQAQYEDERAARSLGRVTQGFLDLP